MPVDIDLALKALAQPVRRDIVQALSVRSDVCACELVELFKLAPSTVSHHMSALVGAGLVSSRKQGTWVHYSLDRQGLHEVVGLVAALTEAGGQDAH